VTSRMLFRVLICHRWVVDYHDPSPFLVLGFRVSRYLGEPDAQRKSGFDRFGFTLFVLSFQVWSMAGNPNMNEAVLHEISWVGRGLLDAISVFS
jgi:hypothetical protein